MCYMNNVVEDIIRSGKFKRLIENILVNYAKQITGLNRIELVIIYLLYRYDELNTLTDISGYMKMNKGHISTTLDGLSKKGYIICQRDEADHRYFHYRITEKAETVAVNMDNSWAEISKKLVRKIDKNDLEVFHKVGKQIEDNMEEMLEEYRKN